MARQPHSSILDTVWDGKYLPDGMRRAYELPKPVALDVLEMHEPRTARKNAKGKTSSSRLIHGDNLAAGAALLLKLRGKVKLVYLDPPFNLGRAHVGVIRDGKGRQRRVECYGDTWGTGSASFAHQLWLRLKLAHDLLAPNGTIVLHGNDHTAPLLRALLDDVFGAQRFLNEIVWHYTGGGRSRHAFSNKHDIMYWYAKGAKHIFNADSVRVPYKPTSGYARGGIVSSSGKRYLPHPGGTIPDDVWDIPIVNPLSHERTGYATQKPLALLERIVAVASNRSDIVADLYCGSGTTAVAAQKLGRRWLACDTSALAVHHARLRLVESGAEFELSRPRAPASPNGKTATSTPALSGKVRHSEAMLDVRNPKELQKVQAWCVVELRTGVPVVVAHTARDKSGALRASLSLTEKIRNPAGAAYGYLGERWSIRFI